MNTIDSTSPDESGAKVSNDALVDCETCKKPIAKSAANCIHCGAVNNWIDPRIKKIIEAIRSGTISAEKAFSYEYANGELGGITDLVEKKSSKRLQKFAGGCGLFGFLFLFIIPALGGFLITLFVLSIFLPSFIEMITGKNILIAHEARSAFWITCNGDRIEWKSDNDTVFYDLKKYVESLR